MLLVVIDLLRLPIIAGLDNHIVLLERNMRTVKRRKKKKENDKIFIAIHLRTAHWLAGSFQGYFTSHVATRYVTSLKTVYLSTK